jgi:thiol-disulfide isomerase/thioredoxin
MSNCKIILVKANWCGHCHHFFPIFKEANKLKKDKDIEYISYDTASNKKIIHNIKDKDKDKDENNNKYINETITELKDDFQNLNVEGYPTVFVFMFDDKGNIKKNTMIEHVQLDNNAGETEDEITKEAAIRFNKKVENGIKTLKSDGKRQFIESNVSDYELKRPINNELQVAGGINGKTCGNLCSIDSKDKNYELKYLKYKSKYLELKKKLDN